MKKSTILLCRFLQLFGYSFQHQYLQAISQNTRLARSLTTTLGEQAWKEASHCPEFADDVEIIGHLDSRSRELTNILAELQTGKQAAQAQARNNRPQSQAAPKQMPDLSAGAISQQRTRLRTLIRELQERRKNLSGVMDPDHAIFSKLDKQEEEYKLELDRLENRVSAPASQQTNDQPEIPEAIRTDRAAAQMKDITSRINAANVELKKVRQTLASSYLHLGNAICTAWQADKNIRRQLSRHKQTMALIHGIDKSIKKYERLVRTKPKARENSLQP